jgi:hypothetical protein
VAGCCGHANELLVPINGREFLDKLGDFCFSRGTLLDGDSYKFLLH